MSVASASRNSLLDEQLAASQRAFACLNKLKSSPTIGSSSALTVEPWELAVMVRDTPGVRINRGENNCYQLTLRFTREEFRALENFLLEECFAPTSLPQEQLIKEAARFKNLKKTLKLLGFILGVTETFTDLYSSEISLLAEGLLLKVPTFEEKPLHYITVTVTLRDAMPVLGEERAEVQDKVSSASSSDDTFALVDENNQYLNHR